MIDLPTIEKINFEGKNVLVRADFNVEDKDNPRANSIKDIVRTLQSKNAGKIKVIGHTKTEYDLAGELSGEFPNVEFDPHLRDNPGEEENNYDFARQLADGWNVFVNEAFSVSHRKHASIVSLPKVIKENGGEVCLGPRFVEEVNNLDKVLQSPKHPLVFLISGLKEDKVSYIESFSKIGDKVLVSGRLPDFIEKKEIKFPEDKVLIANLIFDKEDITIHSMEKFEKEIKVAGTIVVSGPVGKFEDEGHRQGTQRVFQAVAENGEAFKVAGGGDTEDAIKLLDLADKFNWISVGGGAMLEFLSSGTLPGIEALVD